MGVTGTVTRDVTCDGFDAVQLNNVAWQGNNLGPDSVDPGTILPWLALLKKQYTVFYEDLGWTNIILLRIPYATFECQFLLA